MNSFTTEVNDRIKNRESSTEILFVDKNPNSYFIRIINRQIYYFLIFSLQNVALFIPNLYYYISLELEY